MRDGGRVAGGLTRFAFEVGPVRVTVVPVLTSSCLRSSFYLVERAAGGVLSRTGLAWASEVERAGRASPPLRRPPSTVHYVALGAPLSFFPSVLRGALSLSPEAFVCRGGTPLLTCNSLSLMPRPLAISVGREQERQRDKEREREGERKRVRDV